jgi:DNA-binding CsgD family transcriptional regulator
VALGWWLVWTDELEEARVRLEQGHATALAEGDESSMPQLTGWLRELELRAGRLSLAREHACAQLEAAEHLGEPLWVAVAKARMALVDAHLGRAEEARQGAQDALAVAVAGNDAGLALLCEWALGVLELSLGTSAEAAHWLLQADATHERIGLVEPGYARFHADLVEALIEVGRLDEAEAHLQEYERRATLTARRSALGGAARCRALLLAARGTGDDALPHLERAHAAIDALGTPFELARLDVVEGAILRRLRRRREARTAFERAQAGFVATGAAAWAERAARELARTGRRRRAGEELTDTERQVAVLAGRGLTNREIGAQVFLAEKSVEDVLRRVYRLVGVRNKTELAARLAEHP